MKDNYIKKDYTNEVKEILGAFVVEAYCYELSGSLEVIDDYIFYCGDIYIRFENDLLLRITASEEPDVGYLIKETK